MAKTLIIVESPTKARTLSRFLGDAYHIEASMGHVRDLPKAKLGVDVDKDFEPSYVIPKDKRKTVEALKELSLAAPEIVLATDPDREGEAIAWHIGELINESKDKKLKEKTDDLKRIVFHEITQEAIEEAIKNPRSIDIPLVDAQQARRVLDRLVGYKLSPLLWFKVKKGLSAGRVQSIAVRLIVEREKEIEAFKPEEYWSIDALLSKDKDSFLATLVEKAGKKLDLKKEKESSEVVKDLEKAAYSVKAVNQKESKKSPYPPFTTSTLTQAASNRFGYTAKKTMKLAQDLYEEGLITYHRTDSFNLSNSILTAAKKYIEKTLGKEYLPEGGSRVYKTKSKVAQEAHEAVRPTNLEMAKEKISLSGDHKKLYSLIWDRFLASQLADAIYDQVSLDIAADEYLLKANGSIIKFPGWLKVYGREEGDLVEEKSVPLLEIGDKVKLEELKPEQHFTQPPPRYTEASLIKALEEKGIGRPSTYAPIISTILDRNYVEREERKFKPTPLGVATNDFLVGSFPHLIDVSFTADMEDSLDSVANGEKEWVPIIREFFDPFKVDLDKAYKNDRVKVEAEMTDEVCPEGHHMVIRYGRFGKFLACEKFPDHKFTKRLEEKVEGVCPDSGDPIVVRRTKRGRPFFGCSAYPKCKWMSWKKPEDNSSKIISATAEA
ncbi:MAG TPA: type I DNA topoisomerase [Candidatus Saccharimonadales bacterium]|nr:type I DNA topoisomerase [Candidatus Saccharimonadales bacterium]